MAACLCWWKGGQHCGTLSDELDNQGKAEEEPEVQVWQSLQYTFFFGLLTEGHHNYTASHSHVSQPIVNTGFGKCGYNTPAYADPAHCCLTGVSLP